MKDLSGVKEIIKLRKMKLSGRGSAVLSRVVHGHIGHAIRLRTEEEVWKAEPRCYLLSPDMFPIASVYSPLLRTDCVMDAWGGGGVSPTDHHF